MKIKLLLFNTLLLFINVNSVKAQVLFNDDFDNHNIALLSNDATGNTSGQGNWFVTVNNSSYEANVDSESNKGNVLGVHTKSSTINSQVNYVQQKQLATLWNARTAGNNILKLEFDFYIYSMVFSKGSGGGIGFNLNLNDIQGNNIALLNCAIVENGDLVVNGTKINGVTGITWAKTEMFIDYNTNNVFYYIPSLNYSNFVSITNLNQSVDEMLISFDINKVIVVGGGAIRFDNFEMSALQTLPTYLSVDEFISEKLNVYPNPTNNIVNLISSDDIVINEIVVYDLSGKKLKNILYNYAKEVQINIEDLAEGVYLLDIKTNKGITQKKIIKK